MGRIRDLMPATTPPAMFEAWIGCVSWALGNPDVLQQFREDTGNQWMPGRTPLERKIDNATGADWEFIKAFILWVNDHIWGDVDS